MRIIKKVHNKYPRGLNYSRHILRFGQFGIKVVSPGRLTKTQLSSLNRTLLRKFKEITSNKTFKLWNLAATNLTLTKLSSESRMGKGKGAIYAEALFLKPGSILFEFTGVNKQQAIDITNYVKNKVSFKIILIYQSS